MKLLFPSHLEMKMCKILYNYYRKGAYGPKEKIEVKIKGNGVDLSWIQLSQLTRWN